MLKSLQFINNKLSPYLSCETQALVSERTTIQDLSSSCEVLQSAISKQFSYRVLKPLDKQTGIVYRIIYWVLTKCPIFSATHKKICLIEEIQDKLIKISLRQTDLIESHNALFQERILFHRKLEDLRLIDFPSLDSTQDYVLTLRDFEEISEGATVNHRLVRFRCEGGLEGVGIRYDVFERTPRILLALKSSTLGWVLVHNQKSLYKKGCASIDNLPNFSSRYPNFVRTMPFSP